MVQEKRAYYRLPKETIVKCKKIEYSDNIKEEEVKTKNISANGLLLVSKTPYNIGDYLKISVTLPLMHKYKTSVQKLMVNPYEEPLVVIGKVVRVEKFDNKYEIGIMFEGIYEDDFNALLNYIEDVKKIYE